MGVIKAKVDLEFILYARMGDAILNRVVREHFEQLKQRELINSLALVGHIISNHFISNFQIGRFKLKRVDQTNPKLKGDIVEAYIAYIYKNKGYDAARTYILTQVSRVLIG